MAGVARGYQRADTLKPYSQKTSQANHTRTTTLSNSMKPSHAHGATQDGLDMVERSDRMWSTGEGNGKPQILKEVIYLTSRKSSMFSLFYSLLLRFLVQFMAFIDIRLYLVF